MSEIVTDVMKPRRLEYGLTLNDYWIAPSGEGPLAATWEDKPHRLLYDLLAALLAAGSEPVS